MAEPTSHQTARVIECVECCRPWEMPSERWRLYVTDEDPPEAVAYCQACGER